VDSGIERLRDAIARADAVASKIYEKATGLVGQRVVITGFDLSGCEHIKEGRLVRIEHWAQYPWSLVLLPKGKRTKCVRLCPGAILAIDTSEGVK
jgi:hypothetical protein